MERVGEAQRGVLRAATNTTDFDAERLWRTYVQLTEAEAAFRIQKSELSLRPIWHQKTERVQAHILVCFLAYVLWKTLEQWQSRAGLGNSPRTILDELGRIQSTDVVLPLAEDAHRTLRIRCVVRPDKAQAPDWRAPTRTPQGAHVHPQDVVPLDDVRMQKTEIDPSNWVQVLTHHFDRISRRRLQQYYPTFRRDRLRLGGTTENRRPYRSAARSSIAGVHVGCDRMTRYSICPVAGGGAAQEIS